MLTDSNQLGHLIVKRDRMDIGHADRASFERLRNAIFDDVANTNVDGVLEKLTVLNDHYKHFLSEEDFTELQSKVNKMIREHTPLPESSEFLLFIAFGILIVLLFGEIKNRPTRFHFCHE